MNDEDLIYDETGTPIAVQEGHVSVELSKATQRAIARLEEPLSAIAG